MMTWCGSDNGWPQRQQTTTMMNGHTTMMETGRQRWHDVAATTDDHNETDDNNNDGWCKDYGMGDDGQQHMGAAPPAPLIHSSVVLVYLVNQIHIFPMLVATRPVLNQLRLRLVETGLSTNQNQPKPHWTSWRRFSLVFCGPSTWEDRSWSWSCQIWTKDQTGPDFQALCFVEN